jgi:solute carrier family 39 (zinc transporter), member 1/2/3
MSTPVSRKFTNSSSDHRDSNKFRHCTGGSASAETTCNAPDRDYNVNLRVGLLFAIFVTSAMGVFGPILLYRFMPKSGALDTIFMVIKQFGTGIIISTAFVHVSTIGANSSLPH